MFAAGLEDEVRGLLAQGVTPAMPAMQGIGYKETVSYLQGAGTREEAIAQIQTSTRHFAKRQLTWYRKMPYIHWYDVAAYSGAELQAKIQRDAKGFFAPSDE